MPEWLRRLAAYLRKLARRHRRSVQEQVIRGVAYGVGSGAVSLFLFWYKNHH